MSDRGVPHHNRRRRKHSTRVGCQPYQEQSVQQERGQRRNRSHGHNWDQAGRDYNRQNRQFPQRPPPPRHEATRVKYWTHEDLRHLGNSRSQEIAQRVQNEQNAFLLAFKYEGNLRKPFTMKYLIKILYGLSNSQDSNFSSRMLSQIFSECPSFLMKLREIIQISESDSSQEQLLMNLIRIGEFCIENIPQSTVFAFPQSELRETIQRLDNPSLAIIFQDFDKLYQDRKSQCLEQRHTFSKHPMKLEEQINIHDQHPPNNYREVEILPQPEEIQNIHNKPFLRPNIVKGPYHNWDHYLDVQFRLLREDFMGPLRDGIHSYLQGQDHKHNIHLYSGVQVLSPVCLYSGIGFLIQFDMVKSRLTRVQWEHSRRLIFGSLLCLSCDDFRTVYFASVIDRDCESLKNGQLVVKFEGEVDAFEIDPAVDFMMVESTAYFEAYRHVLNRLQNVRVDQMPFRSYIVNSCQGVKDIPLPLYLRSNSCLDLNSILKPVRALAPVDVKRWPTTLPKTSFDESQLKALQMALSQELSVIQGPPGTGKTYIGLKIVEALLQNRRVWDPRNNCPILVVCYTNHALDQFLEGVLECRVGSEKPKVVRVGGRCKNEKIKHCAMANLVSEMKSKHLIPRQVYEELNDNRSYMNVLQDQIEASLGAINAKEGNVLTVDDLFYVLEEHHYQQLIMACQDVPAQKIIEYWLDLWFLPFEEVPKEDDVMNEESQLEVALQVSQEMYEPPNRSLEPPDVQEDCGLIVERATEDNEDWIEVLDEPQLLEEKRMLEGERAEIMIHHKAELQLKEKEEKVTKSKDDWKEKQLSSKERKNRINRGMKNTPMKQREASEVLDVWKLRPKQRWCLYKYWLNDYIRLCKGKLKASADIYNRCAQQCQETDHELNALTLANANVVGMTTTGAAKHSYILKTINPKIVIVEEAAEVLESHIITSLCSSVQQLILIGDHKQLQPKITYFDLEKTYNLHVSLFERLAMNGLPIATLEVQHRMRPEIASIVGNHIYERLHNHESVLNYEFIKGVSKNLFFVSHNYPEKKNPVGDQRSHANMFEADYIVALTRYFLKQGYDQSEITILTMYRGQLFEIRQKMRKDEFDGVRVAAVDDFQGEENDIIILSLVRSNDEGKIGFLKVENRVCVSLSRAKKGMFVIGNLSMLRDKDNTKWSAILGQLDKEGCVGDGLPLCCQNHPQEAIIAKIPQDFSKCPEGGCQKPCNFRLECGHVCRSLCHPIDREHKLIYKCQQTCKKKFKCGHECSSKCYECQDGCLPCQVSIACILPQCGHEVRMTCSQDPAMFFCQNSCNKLIVGCGHHCQNKCSENCTPYSKCQEKVIKPLLCGHTAPVSCSVNVIDFSCPIPCMKPLDCYHPCKGTCGSCSNGRLHIACQQKCDRTLACGHICLFPCTSNCPPCTQKCNNYCYHSKCPKMCYEPCVPCREPCQWKCKHFKCTAKCGDICNRPKCNVSCQNILRCGHQCIGLCGEECPKLCRFCNEEEVCEIFFGNEDEEGAQFIQLKDCGHIFEVSGMDYWMEQENEKDSHVIKFIECPKCKTPIRRSLRYGNIIKKTISDMEAVKRRVLEGSEVNISELQRTAESIKTQSYSWEILFITSTAVCESIKKAIDNAKPNVPPLLPHKKNTIENQLALLPKVVKLFECLDSFKEQICPFTFFKIDKTMLLTEANKLTNFLNTSYLSPQKLTDAECELRRLFCLARVCQIQMTALREKQQFSSNDQQELNDQAELLLKCGCDSPQVTTELQEHIDQLLERLTRAYNIGGLTERERLDVVKAMSDIKKGAWYKCPNGHIYCISDCGGAMVESNCPECGARIGGTGHRLLSDNQHAGEMDDSRHAAWSEAANMRNYDPMEF